MTYLRTSRVAVGMLLAAAAALVAAGQLVALGPLPSGAPPSPAQAGPPMTIRPLYLPVVRSTHARQLGHLDGTAQAVAAGDGALFAAFDSWLLAYDVAGTTDPVLVGRWQLAPSRIEQLALDGRTLFVASSGIQVLDATEPSRVRLLATVDGIGPTEVRMAASGGYLYVAGGAELWVVDASDGSRPRVVGRHRSETAVPDPVDRIAVEGDHAFVAALGGVRVFDVSDPTAPAWLGAWSDLVGRDIAVSGSNALALDDDLGRWRLSVADVSEPARPRLLASTDVCPGGAYDNAVLALDAGVATVACHGVLPPGRRMAVEVSVVDVSSPDAPRLTSSLELAGDRAHDLAAEGGRAFVASTHGIAAILLRPDDVAEQVWRLPALGASLVEALDTTLVVLDNGQRTIWSYDLAEPDAPRLLGGNPTGSPIVAMVADGRWRTRLYAVGAYDRFSDPVEERDGGYLAVFEDDPAGVARETARLDLGCVPSDLGVTGHRAYVACVGGPIRAVDVFEPLAPRSVDLRPGDVRADRLAAGGDRLVTVDGRRVTVFRIDDPLVPVAVGQVDLPWPEHRRAAGLHLSGDFAFVAGWRTTVIRVPVDLPPIVLAELPESSCLALFGGMLASGRYGDVRLHDWVRGTTVATTALPGEGPVDMLGRLDHLYVARSGGGLDVLRAAAPEPDRLERRPGLQPGTSRSRQSVGGGSGK